MGSPIWCPILYEAEEEKADDKLTRHNVIPEERDGVKYRVFADDYVEEKEDTAPDRPGGVNVIPPTRREGAVPRATVDHYYDVVVPRDAIVDSSTDSDDSGEQVAKQEPTPRSVEFYPSSSFAQ